MRISSAAAQERNPKAFPVWWRRRKWGGATARIRNNPHKLEFASCMLFSDQSSDLWCVNLREMLTWVLRGDTTPRGKLGGDCLCAFWSACQLACAFAEQKTVLWRTSWLKKRLRKATDRTVPTCSFLFYSSPSPSWLYGCLNTVGSGFCTRLGWQWYTVRATCHTDRYLQCLA